MPREKRGPRKVGLTSPQILVPAVVGLALVALLLVVGLARGGAAPPRPSESRTYDAFIRAVRDQEVEGVQMYRDILYVTPRSGATYLVQDVSPDSTIGLLTKYKVPLDGIPQSSAAGPVLGAGVLVAVMLPYLFLGWLTVMMVRAAGGAADVDPEAYAEETRCSECSRPLAREARFCAHCAHPVAGAGPVRQCPGCGQQVWRGDRHCRSCGRSLQATSIEARKVRPEALPSAEPSSGVRPPAPRTPRSSPPTPEA